jgi:hypothetical protein
MRVKDIGIPEILETSFKAMNIPIHNPDSVKRISYVGGEME